MVGFGDFLNAKQHGITNSCPFCEARKETEPFKQKLPRAGSRSIVPMADWGITTISYNNVNTVHL